jgi:D-alanine--poly(phosphoribitol) ligase subunit 1
MFTSGSTGTPKGVPITAGCLADFIDWMETAYAFSKDDVFLNQGPYSFDLSVTDMYPCLVTGATLFSITRTHIENPGRLFDALAASGVSIWVSTPSFAQFCLAERRFDRTMLPRLRRMLFNGELLAPNVVQQLFERFPDAEIWNMYGPTEATVAVTAVRVTPDILKRYPALPIGFPKPRTQVLVVDEHGAPLPPGERGEVVIAGPNVSPGYLNAPDATAHSFFRLHEQQAYRTGDLGHFEDGMLFFDGRIDSQFKLHGYRIEPGDIEAHLAALPGVQDAIVIPVRRNGRVDSIHAFVVLRDRPSGSDFEIGTALQAQLAERLPAHMVPRRFRVLETLPLTVNGKVDRRRLEEQAAR